MKINSLVVSVVALVFALAALVVSVLGLNNKPVSVEETLNNNPSIDIAKKEMQKVIINELYKKGVIDFSQCNSIIKKLDEDIIKLDSKFEKKEDMSNMIVKIPI